MDVADSKCKPQKLVSHWWGARFYGGIVCIMQDAMETSGALVDVAISYMDFEEIERKYGSKLLSKAYLMCIFAVNQHISICGSVYNPCNCNTPKYRNGSSLGEMDKFHLVMKHLDGLVVALDEELETLSRVWCVAEIGQTLDLLPSKTLKFKLPGKFSESLLKKPMEDAFRSVSDCESSRKEDKDLILKQIDEMQDGRCSFDDKVKKAVLPIVLRTALHQASSDTMLAGFVTSLLQQRADVNEVDGNGETALFKAVWQTSLAAVGHLIEARANVNVAETSHGMTPLWVAVRYGGAKKDPKEYKGQYLPIMKALLKARADVNKATKDGLTPMFTAAEYGHMPELKLLLEARADVNKATLDGETPTWAAAGKAFEGGLQLLIIHRADVNRASLVGATPVYKAACNSRGSKAIKLLAKERADVNIPMNDGFTPALFAAEHGYLQVLKALIEARADVNKATNSGVTPIFAAAWNGKNEFLQQLFEVRADLNKAVTRCGTYIHAALNEGVTALHIAVRNGYEGSVKLLLEEQADTNATDISGNTPLSDAKINGFDNIVRLLVEGLPQLKGRGTRNRHDVKGATGGQSSFEQDKPCKKKVRTSPESCIKTRHQKKMEFMQQPKDIEVQEGLQRSIESVDRLEQKRKHRRCYQPPCIRTDLLQTGTEESEEDSENRSAEEARYGVLEASDGDSGTASEGSPYAEEADGVSEEELSDGSAYEDGGGGVTDDSSFEPISTDCKRSHEQPTEVTPNQQLSVLNAIVSNKLMAAARSFANLYLSKSECQAVPKHIRRLSNGIAQFDSLLNLDLNLSYFKHLTDLDDFGQGLGKLSQLQTLKLNLNGCCHLEQVYGLKYAVGQLSGLKELQLQLSNCSALDCLDILGTSFLELKVLWLDLEGCTNLSSIKLLGEGRNSFTPLEELTLNLAGCYELPHPKQIVDCIETYSNLYLIDVSLPPSTSVKNVKKLLDIVLRHEISSFFLGLEGCDVNLPEAWQKNFDNLGALQRVIDKL